MTQSLLLRDVVERLVAYGKCSISGSAYPAFTVWSRPDGSGERIEAPMYLSEFESFIERIPFPVRASFSYRENTVYLEKE